MAHKRKISDFESNRGAPESGGDHLLLHRGSVLLDIAGVIQAVPVAIGIKTGLAVLCDEPPGRSEARPNRSCSG
jgi:hypothetical protein